MAIDIHDAHDVLDERDKWFAGIAIETLAAEDDDFLGILIDMVSEAEVGGAIPAGIMQRQAKRINKLRQMVREEMDGLA